MMTEKRYNVIQNRIGDWIVEDTVGEKYLLKIPKFLGFDDEESANVFCEELNELHEENQSIKKHIKELYNMVKVDVDNEIEVYPKTLMEYILNILKIIGDVE